MIVTFTYVCMYLEDTALSDLVDRTHFRRKNNIYACLSLLYCWYPLTLRIAMFTCTLYWYNIRIDPYQTNIVHVCPRKWPPNWPERKM